MAVTNREERRKNDQHGATVEWLIMMAPATDHKVAECVRNDRHGPPNSLAHSRGQDDNGTIAPILS
jgi:hypothetical protein